MRVRTLLSATLTLLVSLNAIADLRVPVSLRSNEWIGAWFVGDDGSGAVVVRNASTRTSRLIRFDSRGTSDEATIEGISINVLQPIATNRYFVRGAVGAGDSAQYVARVIEVGNRGVVTHWDSTRLGSALQTDEEGGLVMDRDGRQWAALTPRAARQFSIVFGDIESDHPTATYHFEARATFTTPPPLGYSGGTWELVSVGDGHVAALTPVGTVYVVSAGHGVKAILSPERGGGHMQWSAPTKTLWVQSGDTWTAFPLAAVISQGKTRTASPASARATVTTLEAPGIARPSDVGARALIASSPGARALLILPEGTRSSEVLVRVR